MNPTAKEVVIEVMRHFGFRRNYQVAKYFNVTPQTLSGWMKSGEIPPKHLMKYNNEIADTSDDYSKYYKYDNAYKEYNNITGDNNNYSAKSMINIIKINYKTILFIPLCFTIFSFVYVFLIAEPVYTSKSKVLPISEDGSSSNSFTGFASQLGINIPLNIGGKVPWDEIYPEIIKSSDLLTSMLEKNYVTNKHGSKSLKNIIIDEYRLDKYSEQDQKNRVIGKLREMIKISKLRNSPIVNIDVMTFEPLFASEISRELILRSSLIQRQLKTNRIKQKRLFIEERLNQVSLEMKRMELELRKFRENNRNLSSSPSLQMMVQEMGREVDLQNSLYVTLKTQYEKAKIDEVGRDDMVQQIDGPSIPTKLTSPKRALNVLIMFSLGLFTSFFIVYLKEQHMIEN